MIRRTAVTAVALALTALLVPPAQATTRVVITGAVTDAAGHPVAGAVVEYHDLSGHELVTTDAAGAYRVRVRARYHGYLDVTAPGEHLPRWTSGDLVLEPGDSLVRDVTLPASGVPTVLYGRVTDAGTGKPVKRLHLRSYIHEGDNISDAWTDRDGWYAFTEFDAQGEGFGPLRGEFVYDLYSDATSRYAQVIFNEESPIAAGPGVTVAENHRVRFDFTVRQT